MNPNLWTVIWICCLVIPISRIITGLPYRHFISNDYWYAFHHCIVIRLMELFVLVCLIVGLYGWWTH